LSDQHTEQLNDNNPLLHPDCGPNMDIVELKKSRGKKPHHEIHYMPSEEIEAKDDGGDLSPMQTCWCV
jgi:hypothetical protein